ncbi:hypothetical protein Dsin_011787 [Dipteronia sinensis]|uniref:Uncharacterized protein n=1 Tax=Dipteronia sinensis TaxID=43782 RepID=A0AAE0AGX0_9ROSI|nr:hypothetical protein Dsin_011787 [Dipteronia sinensis]
MDAVKPDTRQAIGTKKQFSWNLEVGVEVAKVIEKGVSLGMIKARKANMSLLDHNAITLGASIVDWGPSPFRFYNWWMEDNDLMKEAIQGWQVGKNIGSWLSNLITKGLKVVVGRGDRAVIWNETSWDNMPLRVVFPRVFALAVNKTGAIKDFGHWAGSCWVWELKLRRPVFDWEHGQWECLRNF